MHAARPKKDPIYKLGQRVEGFLHEEWLPGRITDHNRDGSYCIRFDDGHEMSDMAEVELRYLEDEVLVAAAIERERLWQLHTALRHAANHGELVAAQSLMDAPRIDVDDQDGAGWSALTWACRMGRLGMVEYLLEMGADINSEDNNLETPLIWACRKNQIDVVDKLVVSGAALDQTNQLGWTALMEASSRGYNDALCILLHKGADFNIKNIEGKTAMDLAKSSTTVGLIKAADGEYY